MLEGSSLAGFVGSERFAWAVVDAMPGASVIVVDQALRVVLAAGESVRSQGHDPRLLEGRLLEDLLPDQGFEDLRPYYERALLGIESTREARSFNGQWIFATEFSPVRDGEGEIVGAMALSKDVTMERAVQDALAASERDFRLLAEEATDLIARFDTTGVCLYASPALERLSGFSPQEALGRPVYEFIHPDDVAEVAALHRRVLDSPEVVAAQYRLVHKDGRDVLVESTIRQHADPDSGRPVEIHAVTRDVSDREAAADLRRQWEQTFIGTQRGICVTDGENRTILSVNPAFAEMHGGTVEDFAGRPLSLFLPPDVLEQLPALREQVDRQGLVTVDSEHLRLDGTRFPVRAEVLAPSYGHGRSTMRIAWFENLTEQRAIEAAREAATRVFEKAFALAPTGIVLTGLDGRFERVNDAACTMLGRTEEELIGLGSSDVTHPKDIVLTYTAFQRLATDHDAVVSLEKRFVRPDGETVWASVQGTAVTDEAGEPLFAISHLTDITEAKRVEKERAEATRRFEAAFADAPIGMALVGLDGMLLKVNHVLCELTAYSEHELLEKTFQDLTHPDDRDADVASIEQLLEGDIDRYATEKRFFTAGGHQVWVNLSVSIVRDEQQEPLHFIAHVEDISDRKRMEATLVRLADHDSLTDLWNRRRFEEELHRQVGRCQRYGERAALLLIDLDDFKPVNDHFGHKAGDDLLKAIAAALAGRVRETDAVARLGGDEFGVLLTNTSPDQAAALSEALKEAIEAATIERDDRAIGVTVSVGIVFLDERTTSDTDAMLQADAAMYELKGARIAAMRSRREEATAASAVRKARRAETNGSGKQPLRIVHCDDAEAYRRLLKEMLATQSNLDVVGEARNASEAEVVVAEHAPDVILLDARMDGTVDASVVPRLRSLAPQAKIVVLSGLDEAATPLAELADAYVEKARSFDEIADVIVRVSEAA